MNTPYLFRRWGLLLLLCVLMAGMVSCAEEVATGPRVWIDFPQDKSVGPVGTPVAVVSHAYAPEGIAEMLLSVNGEAYRRDPPQEPGATFSEVSQEWLPQEPGVYTLQVQVYDTTGVAIATDSVTVKVVGESVPRPTEEPTEEPTVVPTQEPTEEPTVEPTEEPTLEPTEEPTLVPTQEPTEEPSLPVQVDFRADATSLEQGDCTALRWEVENATTVSLDGSIVAESGTQQICPESTTTYNLHVEAPGGDVDRSVTVNVTTPPPPANVNFWVDQDSITAGECTVLHWEVQNATAVYLNGAGVAGQGTQQICPTSTTTYNLQVEAPGGNVNRSVTVNVSIPPPAEVNFRADRDSLTVGECTTLRWDVEYATAVYLNGTGVVGHGMQEVCPESTTTYDLHVEAPSGNVDRSVTINVSAPVDTQGPDISGLKSSEETIDYSCDYCSLPCKTDISANVTDDSGVAWVKLIYKPPKEGERTGGMANVGGASYKATVNANGWKAGTLEFWVRAMDNKGNVSESGHGTITVKDCVY